MDRTITVTGSGAARVAPDVARVRLSAVHRAAGVGEAFAGVSSTIEAMSAIAREHTDAHRIASTDVSVWPSHDHQGNPDGFEARHGLQVSVPDLDVAGAMLSRLAEQVGDRMHLEGVALEVSEPGPHLERARDAAYDDALGRARRLAQRSGAEVGQIVRIEEGGSGFTAPAGMRGVAMMSKDAGFESGEQALTVSVTYTWELRGSDDLRDQRG